MPKSEPSAGSRAARSTQPLRTRAYDELKESLLDGSFAPGTLLSERKLASTFGMSKTPVRAALERLEGEGFLTISPQQGVLVRELSIREIVDQYELRECVEPFVLSKLAGRLDPDQVARVRDHLSDQRRALSDGELSRFTRLDGEFHVLFCEFHGNEEIASMMAHLREKILRVSVQLAERFRERPAESLAEHERIAEAVISGDSCGAAEAVRVHIEAGRRGILS
ncbi:MAG: GntR family transcriptional regulator [Planctomycetota bacterium]